MGLLDGFVPQGFADRGGMLGRLLSLRPDLAQDQQDGQPGPGQPAQVGQPPQGQAARRGVQQPGDASTSSPCARRLLPANDLAADQGHPRIRQRRDPRSSLFSIPRENGYTIFRKPGSLNGSDGVFEIGVNKDGAIDHRFFRRDK